MNDKKNILQKTHFLSYLSYIKIIIHINLFNNWIVGFTVLLV